jgi:SH3-like domain-containing protein
MALRWLLHFQSTSFAGKLPVKDAPHKNNTRAGARAMGRMRLNSLTRLGMAFAMALALALGSVATAQDAVLRPMARPAALDVAADAPDPAADVNTPTEVASAEAITEAGAEPEGLSGTAPPRDPGIGPETNLPLPRFVSLKTNEGNVRRGPSLSHRIDWVFTREDMPLQIVAEFGHWRRIIDREGVGGWVHYSLLSGNRTVIVDQDMLPLRTRPQSDAPESALLESGVIARLGQCLPDWCRISAGGYRGWAPKTALWGVGPDEVRD